MQDPLAWHVDPDKIRSKVNIWFHKYSRTFLVPQSKYIELPYDLLSWLISPPSKPMTSLSKPLVPAPTIKTYGPVITKHGLIKKIKMSNLDHSNRSMFKVSVPSIVCITCAICAPTYPYSHGPSTLWPHNVVTIPLIVQGPHIRREWRGQGYTCFLYPASNLEIDKYKLISMLDILIS